MSAVPAGEFGNVQLSEAEHIKLLTRFGASVTAEYIEKLSCWFADHPRKAKASRSHYARILSWIRKDRTIELATPQPTAPLIEEAELRERATIIHEIRMNELNAWISDAMRHFHIGETCSPDQCRWAAEKRPQVPTIEEIIERLKS